MKPFVNFGGQPQEAVEVLEAVVKFLLSDQVKVGEMDDMTAVWMTTEDWEMLHLTLETALDALDKQDKRDQKTLLEMARKGLDRPDPSTRIGRQLNKFVGE